MQRDLKGSSQDLMWEFDDAVAAYWKQWHQDLKEWPCRVGEMRVLWHIAREGNVTGTRLASTLGISRAAASNVLKRLSEGHWVHAVVDSRDHRRRRWVATPAARDLLLRAAERRERGWTVIRDQMTAEQRGALHAALKVLARAESEWGALAEPGPSA